MLCRDEAEVIEKLCSLGDKFDSLYQQKKYPQAMHTYFSAVTVAVFMETEEDVLHYLFGNPDTKVTDEKGIFNKDKVSKAHLECIKQGKSYPFVGTAEMLQALTDT